MSKIYSVDEATLMERHQAEEIASRVIGIAYPAKATVSVESSLKSYMRFSSNEVDESSERPGVEVSLHLEVDGKKGSSSTNQITEDGLQKLVADARSMVMQNRREPSVKTSVKTSPYDKKIAKQNILEGPKVFFDSTIAGMNPELQREHAEYVIGRAKSVGQLANGSFWITADSQASMSSDGKFTFAKDTYGEFRVTSRTPDRTGSGSGWSGHEDWSKVNFSLTVDKALDVAERSKNPSALEPGRYTVIMEPEAAAQFVRAIVSSPSVNMDAEAADKFGTVFSRVPKGNKIGLKMMDDRLSIVSDPWYSEMPFSIYGGDEQVRTKTIWFDRGVLRNLVYKAAYAKSVGREPLGGPPPMILETHGNAQTLEDMIASTDRGLWVNSFGRLSVMNRRSLLMSGCTRDGVFLIENGRITRPVKNFRFLESPFFIFNSLEAFGTLCRAAPNVCAPRLKVRDFSFTSITDAI